ncbi:MAG: hypothetical protein J3K34DRAFT_519621 [Monoraphidium minutum]|nr:MAG: hypothetical protein J3K34DRAFT_519621 [Monoraphidium minutum]
MPLPCAGIGAAPAGGAPAGGQLTASRAASLALPLGAEASEMDFGAGGGLATAKDRAVRVAVRLRPPLRAGVDREAKSAIELDPVSSSVVAADGANRLHSASTFQFDSVFAQDAAQGDVYMSCVAPLVSRFLAGYNATVMAYGQTGSGKTHTIGREDQKGDHMGVLQRAIRDVFTAAAAMQGSGEAEVELRVQFVEIYNEEVRDLLDPAFDHRLIRINEAPDGAIVLEGVLQEPVEADRLGADRALDLFLLGCQSRVVGTTNLNLRSSRAHAIYTLTLSRRPAAEPGVAYTSKLHVVDLAGSERCKRTGAEGARMREAISINSGLLVLQKVMAALQANSRKGPDAQHVPYRESRLTRLLQDSLGGNAYIAVIACVSGEAADIEETLLTLKYAAGVRRIKGAPTLTKKVTSERHVQQIRDRLLALLARSAAAVQSTGSGAAAAVGGVAAGSTTGLRLLRQLPEEAIWQLLLDMRLQLQDGGGSDGGSVAGSECGLRLTPRTCAAFAAELERQLDGPEPAEGCASPKQQGAAGAAARGSVGMSLGMWLGGPAAGGAAAPSAPASDILLRPPSLPSRSASGAAPHAADGFTLPRVSGVSGASSPDALNRLASGCSGGTLMSLCDGGEDAAASGDGGPRPPYSHCMPLVDVKEDDGEYYTTPVATPKASPRPADGAAAAAAAPAGAEGDWGALSMTERMAVLERCYGGEGAKVGVAPATEGAAGVPRLGRSRLPKTPSSPNVPSAAGGAFEQGPAGASFASKLPSMPQFTRPPSPAPSLKGAAAPAPVDAPLLAAAKPGAAAAAAAAAAPRARTPPPSRGSDGPPPPAAAAPDWQLPGTPGQGLSRSSSLASSKGGEGGHTWTPSAWAAGASCAAPSRIPALRSPQLGASPVQMPPPGRRPPAATAQRGAAAAPAAAAALTSAQGQKPAAPEGAPTAGALAAEPPQAPAEQAGVEGSEADGQQEAVAAVGADALRRPMSFTSIGGLKGWAAVAEGLKPDDGSPKPDEGPPAAPTAPAPASPAPASPAPAAPPPAVPVPAPLAPAVPEQVAAAAGTAAVAAPEAACSAGAGGAGAAAAFQRLMDGHLGLVTGDAEAPAAAPSSGSRAVSGSPALGPASASDAGRQTPARAATPAAGGAAPSRLPPPLLASLNRQAGGAGATPPSVAALASASTVHPLPCDDDASVTLSWSDLEDDDGGAGGGAKPPAKRAAAAPSAAAIAASATAAAATVAAATRLPQLGGASPAGGAAAAAGAATPARGAASSSAPGRVEELISRINAALDCQQEQAAAVGGAEGVAQAADAARAREEVGQALQVLARPAASARSVSHASSASSDAGGGPTVTMLGSGGKQWARGSQRQLAAKLATALRSGGSPASSAAGGSQAGGSQVGGGADDSGSDGDCAASERSARGAGAGGAAAAPARGHGAWLSSATREELAKMTKAAARGALAPRPAPGSLMPSFQGGAAGGGGGGAGALKRT